MAATWWTPERLALLRKLARQGRTSQEIAATLRQRYDRPVSAQAVRQQCSNRNISLRARCPRWTPAQLDFVRRKAREGYTAREIAEATARRYRRTVTRDAINDLCQRHGISLSGRWWTPKRLAPVREMAAQGYTARKIAAAVNRRYGRRVSPQAVRQICWRCGIPLRRGPGYASFRP